MAPPKPGGKGGLWLVLLVVVGIGAGVASFVTQGGDDEPGESDDAPATTDVEPPSEPGSAEDIDVIEEGGRAYTDPIFGDQFGWAVILKNNGEQVAELIHVVVELKDDDGNVVDTREDYLQALGPGEKIGIGDALDTRTITRVEVASVEVAGFSDPDGHGKLVTSEVTHSVGSLDRIKVSFSADSTWDEPIERPTVRVIFRNAEGELIGGVTDFSSGFIDTEGSFRDNVELNHEFEGIDPDKTEVYLEPSE